MDDATLSKLRQLGELRQQGILTEEEFSTQKGILLGAVTSSANPKAPVPAPVESQPPTPPEGETTRKSSPVAKGLVAKQLEAKPPAQDHRQAGREERPPAPEVADPVTTNGDSTRQDVVRGRPMNGKSSLVKVGVVVAALLAGVLIYQQRVGAEEAEAARAAAVLAEHQRLAAEARAAEAEEARQEAENVQAYTASLPVISHVLTVCDDSCASLMEDCRFVECVVTNGGGTGAKVTLNLSAGKRISTKQVFVAAGGVETIRSKIRDSSAKRCGCDILEFVPIY